MIARHSAQYDIAMPPLEPIGKNIEIINIDEIYDYIVRFKLLSDLILSKGNMQNQIEIFQGANNEINIEVKFEEDILKAGKKL